MSQLADFVVADTAERAEESERNLKLREKAKVAETRAKTAETQNADLRKRLQLVESLGEMEMARPGWLAPKRRSKKHRATASLLLSDLHLDEVVDPAQVEFANKYDRRIAELRLKRVFERTIIVARDYVAGVEWDGVVCWLGGDIFSGNIHEELKETNEATILESLDHWLPRLADGIDMLAGEFGKVHVPVVPGNHGRMTRKPIAKNRAQDNFDWYVGKALAREFKSDDRVTFQVSDAPDTDVAIYDTQFLFTHGDQFRGGSGIAGMLSPLMLGKHRKTSRNMQLGRPFDWMVMGHWHQYASVQGLIINGSLKGYDEYAFVSNFGYEDPRQAFWVTTPEHGITISAPILALDRKVEKW